MYRTTHVCHSTYMYYIGLKQSHMYTNIDISQRLRQSGILEKSEYNITMIIH